MAAVSVSPNRIPRVWVDWLLSGVRLSVEATPELRVERVLATARTGVAVCSLVAIALQQPSAPRPAVAEALLVAYCVYSIALAFVLRLRRDGGARLVQALHIVDVGSGALITSFTGGPTSPFFGFFVFAILAAAYRWGLRATLGTAVGVTAILGAQVIAVVDGARGPLVAGALNVDLVITRFAYVLIGSALLGYMAEAEKDLRGESTTIARIIVKAQQGRGLSDTLTVVSEELLRAFGAERLLLVMEATRAERLFLWEAERASRGAAIATRYREEEFVRGANYLFEAPPEAWAAVCERPGGAIRVSTVDSDGRLSARTDVAIPDSFRAERPFRRLLAASVSFGQEWHDRVFLFEPARSRVRDLRLLSALLRQVGPAIYNVFLVGRLRTRVGAIERATVARELHDGIIQSLIGLEMHVDALRRHSGDATGRTASHLAEIQQVLRQEVASLRELMQRMRPVHLDPGRLTEYLVDLVDKFQRETGIAARFACELDQVTMRPRACTEVARIVQEALANVRKHSGARNVVVRFESQEDDWRLTIEDDGRGFAFCGLLCHADLDSGRLGPMVIKERVRSIGGQLSIDSSPGRGARLEITLPRAAHV